MNEAKSTILAENFLKQIVTPFLIHANNLEVTAEDRRGDVVLKVRGHAEDRGRLIGTQQANFQALQLILAMFGRKNGFRVRLDNILPSTVGEREFQTPFRPATNWDSSKTVAQLADVLKQILNHPAAVSFADQEDNKTTIVIRFSEAEKMPVTDAEMAFALSKIFHAIGMQNGRKIFIKQAE